MKKEYKVDWTYVEDFKKWIIPFGQKVDCIVGILRGGGPLAVIASNLLEKEVYWIEAKSYKKRKAEQLSITNFSVSSSIKGKRVLLVDDIMDKGTTIVKVSELLEAHCPKRVLPVVMVAKENCLSLCKRLEVQYLLCSPSDLWVTFPWEGLDEKTIHKR